MRLLAAVVGMLFLSVAMAGWVTDSTRSRQYQAPLGTVASDPVDTINGKKFCMAPIPNKPGLSAPFLCKEVLDPVPPPPPPPSGSVLFSTDFNIPTWTQGGGSDPAPSTDWIWHHGDWLANGQGDEIRPEANRPGSAGNGFRHYRGVGSNVNGGGLSIEFPSALSEFWVRLYMKFSPGFSWDLGEPMYTKDMYWWGPNGILIFGYQGGAWGLYTDGASNIPSFSEWSTTPAGQWHKFEYHVKQSDGIVEMWVNDVQVLARSGVNLGSGGFARFALGENQCCPTAFGYTDYDDVAVSTTGRIP